TVSLATSAMANACTMTVKNNCDVTIWSMYTSGNFNPTTQLPVGDWEATAGSSVSFTVPDNWTSGRIWGRTNCDFDNNTDGAMACVTGACNGGLECATSGGTLKDCGYKEIRIQDSKLGGAGGSCVRKTEELVNRFNIPMEITNMANCNIASCPADLNTDCPSELQGPTGSNGTLAGCKSACDVGLGGDACTRLICMLHRQPQHHSSSGVPDYNYFKGNCPDAYAYAL
ncbi:thaumatin-like protein, partial [Gymnopus androsaceus JB14]